MIYGLGIDLIEIGRIKSELLRSGDRFCEKVFTEKEIDYCKRGPNLDVQSRCFAGRFTAKEAFFKAIGTGLRNGLRWKDVEVLHDNLGKPVFALKDKALETIKKEKISSIQLSISHGKNVATAVVILEKPENLKL